MVTPELISYIRSQLQKGIDKELIVSRLVGAGWKLDDVHEGFLGVDLYHEPVDGDILFDVEDKSSEENKSVELHDSKDNTGNIINTQIQQSKIEVQEVKPQLQEAEPQLQEAKPQPQEVVSEVQEAKPEIQQDTKSSIEPVPNNTSSNVWIPKNIPLKQAGQTNQISQSSQSNEVKKPLLSQNNFDSISRSVPLVVKPTESNNIEKSNIPNNIPAPINGVSNVIPNTSKNISGDVSKIAMISSYKSDLLSATSKKDTNDTKKSKKKSKKPLIIIIIFLLIAGVLSGLYFSGNLNILNIRRDPKTLLLNNSNKLSSLNSYKTETNISISFPTFANIISGLVTGEAVSSTDKDTILINSLGMLNNNKQGLSSDNFITFKGTLVPNYITMDIKRNNNSNIFVTTPDISSLTDEFTPKPTTVVANEEEFSKIISLFSKSISDRLAKINIYKILSDDIPSYIDSDVLNSYNKLINNVQIIEKGTESIKGIDTYHYSIVADRQLYRDLLNKVSSTMVADLSSEDQSNLNQILNSATVDSFDVWIGKNDNNIYKYSVVVDVPLSQIVDFEDESIGNNVVTISWETTYYDFNTQNNIFMPNQYISTDEFIKKFKEDRVKNDVSSFDKLANDLFSIEKSYGLASNLNASCMKPTPSSLFSPSGHVAKATEQIGAISSLLNKVLAETNNNGFCYSTPKSWVFAVPISDNYSSTSPADYNSFFCIDSVGAEEVTTEYPKGRSCVSVTDSVDGAKTNNESSNSKEVTSKPSLQQTSVKTN